MFNRNKEENMYIYEFAYNKSYIINKYILYIIYNKSRNYVYDLVILKSS